MASCWMRSMLRARTITQWPQARLYSSTDTGIRGSEIRDELHRGVKAALKARDSFTSTTLRVSESVLSEVLSEDKKTGGTVSSSAVVGIVRKAVARRNDAAKQFTQAARPDLAEKERREVDLLSTLLPPPIPEAEIDAALNESISALDPTNDPRKSVGRILKGFYQRIDKALVDSDVVKKRVDAVLANLPATKSDSTE